MVDLEIFTISSLERKRKNLGITHDGVGDKPLTIARFSHHFYEDAYKWCQEQFDDDWVWSRNPNNLEWEEILFLNTEDAMHSN